MPDKFAISVPQGGSVAQESRSLCPARTPRSEYNEEGDVMSTAPTPQDVTPPENNLLVSPCATAHGGEPSRRTLEGNMAKGHAATKRKRRHKSGNRKDCTGATMAKLRQLEAKAVAGK
jgi:hypothetical protein